MDDRAQTAQKDSIVGGGRAGCTDPIARAGRAGRAESAGRSLAASGPDWRPVPRGSNWHRLPEVSNACHVSEGWRAANVSNGRPGQSGSHGMGVRSGCETVGGARGRFGMCAVNPCENRDAPVCRQANQPRMDYASPLNYCNGVSPSETADQQRGLVLITKSNQIHTESNIFKFVMT
jgi:hypothetical protein